MDRGRESHLQLLQEMVELFNYLSGNIIHFRVHLWGALYVSERERERENVCLYVCALFGKRGGEGVRQKEKEKDGEPG